ncbi:DUF4376 domain-containing protein [Burkholderia sp. BDU5]|uniref:DUF4376 domain-containing protein n=1 Tax=Burkholderia sp. BDU5 TaxID=1385590 RepID=UPI000759E3FC|nr:hypothetical protein [Burkholderia sp. BDU5]KVE40086.1 hypothetical protein WS69_06845 [Burkholderia sp. BDU5]
MGQKQAAYDAKGNIVAFYDTSDSPAPEGSRVIDITDAEWLDCTGNQGTRCVQNGALAQVPPPTAAQQLATAQAAQIATLTQACANAITSGFSSNALGLANSYPSTLTDQANQNAAAQCSTGGLLWCATGGTWSFKSHTRAQAQAVVASFVAWLNKCQQQLVTLTDKVNEATSVDAVESIVWVDPQ